MPSKSDPSHKKVWGKGFMAGIAKGLEMAGVENPEEIMKQNKIDRLTKSQTTIARKVLDAVPIQEMWSASQICGELSRHNMKINLKTVEGCLNSLKNTGLIKEPAIGHFRRVTAGSTAAPKVTPLKIAKTGNSERIMESTVAAKEDKSSLESLIEVSEELVKTANNLSAMARKLEQVADEVADEQGADTEELQKLRQLSSLLKDLHGGE